MKNYILTLCLLCVSYLVGFAQMTPIANNFVEVAGVEIDSLGNAWVTETGNGTNNAQVVRVAPNGTKTIVARLPSSKNLISDDTEGPWRSLFLPNNRLAVLMGEGPARTHGRILIFNMAGFQYGVSAPKTMADTVSSIETSSFALAQTGVVNSNPYSMVQTADGSWYVADAGANMVVKVAPNGQRSVFARFADITNPSPVGPPMTNAVPTKIIINPDGGFYVCTLTGFPFNDGQATVYNLSATGVLTPYISRLTLLTDLALDKRTGDLYALQFGRWSFAPSPNFVFGSAKILRIPRGGAYSETVGSNFGPGAGLAIDPSGNLFATSLFTGQLLKLDAPTCANVGLALTSSSTQLTLYGSIRYNLAVTNRSATVANNVRVYWLPPYKRFEGDNKPFAYQSTWATKGDFDGWHGYWTIPNLTPNETASAYFQGFVVNDRLDATQSAQVVACNQRPASGFANDADNLTAQLTTPMQYRLSSVFASKNVETLSVSPNPARDVIHLLVQNKTVGEWTIQLTNAVGQIVFTQKGQNNQIVDIDATPLPNGVYLAQYESADERKTEKVLVQH